MSNVQNFRLAFQAISIRYGWIMHHIKVPILQRLRLAFQASSIRYGWFTLNSQFSSFQQAYACLPSINRLLKIPVPIPGSQVKRSNMSRGSGCSFRSAASDVLALYFFTEICTYNPVFPVVLIELSFVYWERITIWPPLCCAHNPQTSDRNQVHPINTTPSTITYTGLYG